MDYLYAKLNQQLQLNTYTGGNTDTISVTVDNTNNIISANAILDTQMSDTSTNGVQNSVIKAYVDSMIEALRNELQNNN